MEYLARTLDLELDELLSLAPAIAVEGAKGVGKSGTALRRAEHSWFLDDPDQRGIARADLRFSSVPTGTVLIDEWQRVPEIWDAVRRSVDAGAPPGRFLLTGSASPQSGVDTHTGAGRILTLRMRPMAIHERGRCAPTVSFGALLAGTAGEIGGISDWGLVDYLQAIAESGFPGILAQDPRLRTAQLNSYLNRIVDREIGELGHELRRPDTLRRWLTAYAAASSTTASYSQILDATTSGDGSQPAKTTTLVYRELLSKIWILDPVSGWSHSRNPLSRLLVSPKHQLADPGLAARLLNLSAAGLAAARGAYMAGPLFESLATLTVRVCAQLAQATVGHMRTKNGDREVDLVVEGLDGQVVAVEVKLAAEVTAADVRQLLWLRDQLPDDVVDLVVLTTGKQAYRRPDGVAVVPLALLGP